MAEREYRCIGGISVSAGTAGYRSNGDHQSIPKQEDYAEQIDLYQFYYLLVHLNLFGSGYDPSVAAILKGCF
ncbi:MAG: fructosamine kinase family protein [Proteiniphilum sp.]